MSALEPAPDPRDTRIRELEAEIERLQAKLPKDPEQIAKEARRRFLKFIVERVNPGYQSRHQGDLSSWTREMWQEAGRIGLIGFNSPPAIGGEGRDARTWCIALEELAKIIEDPGFLVITQINKNWANLMAIHGREDLMARYARPLIKGDKHLAWGIAETADPSFMKSSARKVDGGWVVNAFKPLLTGGEWATVFAIVVRDEASNDTVLFLIERDDPGVTVTPVTSVGAHHCGFVSLTAKDTFLPDDRLWLESDAIGGVSQIFNQGVLNTFAVHLGWMQRMFGLGVEALRPKVRAGQRVLDLPHVQSELGRLQMGIETARSVFLRVIEKYGRGEADTTSEPLTLVFKHVVADRTIDTARTMMTLQGVAGYLDENPWGRYLTHTIGMLQAGMSQDLLPQQLGARYLVEMEMKKLRRVGL